jgi:hypothetical protein
MSDFSDFMTMKIIEERRMLERGISSKTAEVALMEQIKAVKNLNVRAPINLIGQLEVLARYLCVSKAELVMEMLESSLKEAYVMFEKEGWMDGFFDSFYDHMEKNYGVELKRNEQGKVVGYTHTENSQVNEE